MSTPESPDVEVTPTCNSFSCVNGDIAFLRTEKSKGFHGVMWHNFTDVLLLSALPHFPQK